MKIPDIHKVANVGFQSTKMKDLFYVFLGVVESSHYERIFKGMNVGTF